MSLCVSMSDLYEVSSCLHVDMDMESPCLHVDMDMECLHVSVCLHVFMWIDTQSVSMSPCGYGHGVSPCGYRHRVYYELHGNFHVDMDSHMDISMVLDRYYKV